MGSGPHNRGRQGEHTGCRTSPGLCARLSLSLQCVPQESRGFVLGSYLCRCKPGFYGAGGVASGPRAGGCPRVPVSPSGTWLQHWGAWLGGLWGPPARATKESATKHNAVTSHGCHSVPRRGGGGRGVPAGVPAVPPGLCHLPGRCALPDPRGPGAAGGRAVLPGRLHAGRVPQHACLLPLPTEQGKVSLCPHSHPPQTPRGSLREDIPAQCARGSPCPGSIALAAPSRLCPHRGSGHRGSSSWRPSSSGPSSSTSL